MKIHDLNTLVEQVQVFVPHWKPNRDALEKLATLGIAARYPGITVSAEDVTQAYALCSEVWAELLPLFQELM